MDAFESRLARLEQLRAARTTARLPLVVAICPVCTGERCTCGSFYSTEAQLAGVDSAYEMAGVPYRPLVVRLGELPDRDRVRV